MTTYQNSNQTAIGNQRSKPTFGETLRKYRENNNLTQRELGEMFQLTQAAIASWEKNKSRPDFDTLGGLCEVLGIPLSELFGIQDTNALSGKEKQLVNQYRKLSASGQNIASKMIATLLEEETNAHDTALRSDYFLIELEPTPVAAGAGCPFGDVEPEYRFVRKTNRNRHADAIVRVSGASMEPMYYDGDLLYIRYATSADDGDIVVCSTTDGAVVKRMIHHKLHSINPNLPYGEKNEDDNVKILGVVLGVADSADFADSEDIPALEELHAREILTFDRKHGI